METVKGKEQQENIGILGRSITRRQAIKAGGIAAVGLAFSKPLIETVMPKPAFANYVPTTNGRGCTPGFWGGGFGSTLWNQMNDPDWVTAGGLGSNPFTLSTLFGDFFDTCGEFDLVTMSDILPPPLSPPKGVAAAHVLAAFLNRSFFGDQFPLGHSTILSKWTTACAAGTNAAFDSLLAELDPLNNAGCL